MCSKILVDSISYLFTRIWFTNQRTKGEIVNRKQRSDSLLQHLMLKGSPAERAAVMFDACKCVHGVLRPSIKDVRVRTDKGEGETET